MTLPKRIWVAEISIVALTLLSVSAGAQEIPFDANPPTSTSFSDVDSKSTPPPLNDAGIKADEIAAPAPSPAAAAEAPDESAAVNAAPEVQSPVPGETQAPAIDTKRKGPIKIPKAELSGLGDLAPFSDIAVISKRFLPKTHRFELFPNLGFILNDAFFQDFVAGARLGYYFTEKYGLEATYLSISSSNKSVTDSLLNERGIGTQAYVVPVSYYGADFKWSPIYGKIGWMNSRIIPFDFYFVGGLGQMGTSGGGTATSYHVGGGQIFAISKALAFRWDISWFGYQSASTVANQTNGFYSNLHATLGLSFFFPGAKYR